MLDIIMHIIAYIHVSIRPFTQEYYSKAHFGLTIILYYIYYILI